MDLILLGGNSVLNKKWVEDVSQNLKDLFDSINIQYYKHWAENKEMIDFQYEVDALARKAQVLKNYAVFAKSAGTLVTVKTILDGLIKPKFCIFVGIPINWARENKFEIDSWFTDFSYPILVIQNRNDPVCPFAKLRTYVKEHNIEGFEIIETVGDTHHYPNLGQIHQEVAKYQKNFTA